MVDRFRPADTAVSAGCIRGVVSAQVDGDEAALGVVRRTMLDVTGSSTKRPAG
jgi:hypothetical protein